MYVCRHACMHVCVSACMHVCMYACMHVCMYACMHACLYVCMYACMHACMYVCMCVYVWLCMYVRMYVCTLINIVPMILICAAKPSAPWLLQLKKHGFFGYIYMLRGPSGAYIFKRISTYNYNKSNCYMNELTKQKTHLSNEHLFHLQCLCLNVISHCIHFCHPRVVTANKNSSVQWTPLPSTMPLSECHFSLHSLLPSESRHCKQLCHLTS